MNTKRPAVFWLAVSVVIAVTIYLLSAVLLPFVAGALVAYFFAPVVAWLERRGLPRWAGTVAALLLFLAGLILILMLVIPALTAQVQALIGHMPMLIDSLQRRFSDWMPLLERQFNGNLDSIKSGATGAAGDVASFMLKFLGGVLARGVAVINALSLLFITPIVAFYLLRDWPRMLRSIDGWIPRPIAPTVRELVGEMDRIVAAFVRGVGMVCLSLAVFYAVGLSVVGLEFGLAVGIFAGLASFIPMFGAMMSAALALALALSQFATWTPIFLVLAVFAIGQILEGQILTPQFVGPRVGLHPVWIIFALMAGGALFGFVGILLAVPAAAAIGVLTRFALLRYRESAYFQGPAGP
jgi:predicted PurR-regulated permease PerM